LINGYRFLSIIQISCKQKLETCQLSILYDCETKIFLNIDFVVFFPNIEMSFS